MSQIDNVAYGLAIFKAYGATEIHADYNIIYCDLGSTGKKISKKDIKTLEMLGWYSNDGAHRRWTY